MTDIKKDKKILVIDDSNFIISFIFKSLYEKYSVITTNDPEEGLELFKTESPDLVILDIMMPKINGIDVLKEIKKLNFKTGVIVSSGRTLIQDYQLAIENGADFYMFKPFSPKKIQKIVDNYFLGTLKIESYEDLMTVNKQIDTKRYQPPIHNESNYIKFWGTRGSVPVSGAKYMAFGGNTSCLEIRHGDEIVIIDAGTGIFPLGFDILNSSIKVIHLFIGHTHWDHIQAFPFFTPAYMEEFEINIYATKGFGMSAHELFSGMLRREYFPVKLEEMASKMNFIELVDFKVIEIGDIKISYDYTSHPGITFCFKIEAFDKKIGYATDNEFLTGYHGNPHEIKEDDESLEPYRHIIDFFKGCDLLIHEAQYMTDDYMGKVGWGHSSVTNATTLIRLSEIKQWIITHHDPEYSDDKLREKLQVQKDILKDGNIDCSVELAYDGMKILFD
jgi:CheY-like chemotaxis protein